MTQPALIRLQTVLDAGHDWAIAVSGGVDSMTLATVAHRVLTKPPVMIHATSPAVPAAARHRIEHRAELEGWNLQIIEANELADESYRANPVNRCYFCKSALYRGMLAALAGRVTARLASGAILDDLGDYRPGLDAAREAGVRHPLIEAGIDKRSVRALARHFGLAEADLPAQPCLASRIETGIRVTPEDMGFIDRMEAALADLLGQCTVLRVRIRKDAVTVELPPAVIDERGQVVTALAARLCEDEGRTFGGLAPYRRGSAFLEIPA